MCLNKHKFYKNFYCIQEEQFIYNAKYTRHTLFYYLLKNISSNPQAFHKTDLGRSKPYRDPSSHLPLFYLSSSFSPSSPSAPSPPFSPPPPDFSHRRLRRLAWWDGIQECDEWFHPCNYSWIYILVLFIFFVVSLILFRWNKLTNNSDILW